MFRLLLIFLSRKGQREHRNWRMTFVEEMKSGVCHRIDFCFVRNYPLLVLIRLINSQGAKTIWSNTLKESCGSPEIERVGLDRVSRHCNIVVSDTPVRKLNFLLTN